MGEAFGRLSHLQDWIGAATEGEHQHFGTGVRQHLPEARREVLGAVAVDQQVRRHAARRRLVQQARQDVASEGVNHGAAKSSWEIEDGQFV